ncbi:hypothetical protein BpHYR1_050371 [Brachionus plicatilis]|uniref:Homeodomain-like DNA binding domain-containing transcription factor n=1 Tax=Brachionus plicatilis TaxID=10195 RepID=A0A3M7SVA5_BRAPC|nr:hypothetical protein BpHYR1_050371 [Brachionus plicatilis]
MLGVSPKCVSSTKKRYEETGTVSDRSRSGRPRKLTSRDEKRLENTLHPSIKNSPLILILRVKGLAKKKGLESQTARCKQRLNWRVNDWFRVIFSDESNFEPLIVNQDFIRMSVKQGYRTVKVHPVSEDAFLTKALVYATFIQEELFGLSTSLPWKTTIYHLLNS